MRARTIFATAFLLALSGCSEALRPERPPTDQGDSKATKTESEPPAQPAVDSDPGEDEQAPEAAAVAPESAPTAGEMHARGAAASTDKRKRARRSVRRASSSTRNHPLSGLRTVGVGSGYGRGAGPLAQPERPRFNTEGYDHRRDNDFKLVGDEPLSTFSSDVDTASYANVRRFLQHGRRPPPDAVRIEEMINYFSYDYPDPRGEHPFAVYTEVSAAPWNPKHRLLHVGIKGKPISSERVPPRNLVFLLDVSGSMQSWDKLPLLKQALPLLVRQLRPQDRIAIVVYAGATGLALSSTPGDRQAQILGALASLEAGGSTNGGAGIELAYRVAQDHFIDGGINRVILGTDGDFNVGVTNRGDLTRLIERKREGGVFLTVLGFGTGNLKDSQMEMLADKGNGNYAYIDSLNEARKVLVREAGSTLVTIAKDVKFQLEFNPQRVHSYRLIGYENRLLAAQDFNDDTKDAGEIGAGHTVTALYELVPKGVGRAKSRVDPLKYQGERAPNRAASDELLTVKLRYKRPGKHDSTRLAHAVRGPGRKLTESTADFRWSAAVAAFGMLLRDSPHRGNATYESVRQLAGSAVSQDAHDQRRELLGLIDRARSL